MTEAFSDDRVLDAWRANAQPWIGAIADDGIESRRLVTNQAIVDAVTSCRPHTVLDVGCGEGWLTRTLAALGIRAIGVDGVPALIEHARRAGQGDYRVASYDEIAAGTLRVRADVVVANFALIGHRDVDALVLSVPRLLESHGAFVIQTLHPHASSDRPYADGWRPGSWSGIDGNFAEPAPWYFRTLESWVALLRRADLTLDRLIEPAHPVTGRPASVIFVARRAPSQSRTD